MAKVTAVILNWRDPASTIACIESLFKLRESINIIVVDNDSQDGSFERIYEYIDSMSSSNDFNFIHGEGISCSKYSGFNWIRLVSSGRNGGYAYGNNYGLKLALAAPECEYFWILNADVIVPNATALTEMTAYMDDNTDVGICGATVCYADRPTIVQTLGGGTIDKRGQICQLGQGLPIPSESDVQHVEKELSYINGACSFVRRQFVIDVGYMTEDYFLYFEELDWSARGRDRFRLGYCYNSVVLHHVGKSIGTKDGSGRSTLSAYYMNSSLIKFCRRHLRSALPAVLYNVATEIARYLRRGDWKIAGAISCALFQTGAKFPKKLGLI
jgi:GT2 family glycosyltransferase